MRITKENSLFLMIDIQEKFENVIYEMEIVLKNSNILNNASKILSIPLLITEQYPKGLGHTSNKIEVPENAQIFEKTKFSALTDEVKKHIEKSGKKLIVLYGVESHVCLMQSALDLKDAGYNVMLVADAVSSRNPESKKIALMRYQQNDIEIVSTEMIMFEILQSAKHENFREISKLVK